MDDILWMLQEYLDVSTLLNFQIAFPEKTNKKLVQKKIEENIEEVLYHILDFGTNCLQTYKLDFLEQIFANNYDDCESYETLIPFELFEQHTVYNILSVIAEEHIDFKYYIPKSCFNHKLFSGYDAELWS